MDNDLNVNVNNNEELQETQETQESKTFTQDEVMKLIQSETDRRVTSALKKQQKEYEQKLAKSKSLSQLDEEGRKQAEKDMRIQELEEQLKQFNVMQTRAEITKVLGARGLNPQFADLIEIGEDVEEAQQRIDTLDKLFKQAVKEEVQKRLSTSSPKSSTADNGAMTKEKFDKMTLAQKQDLYINNKELYMQLIQR